ncbi:hypothetical protein A7E78_11410 [Syntrophotalea acetylenivorans]|uniref:TonB C-terminal domain-containing protein n=1 Tax=Syntrophotalea acetylenivorans TaxID=1842532 RepID=A0A1L3GR21_9BACT|nr:energy transducer TonB [Syntrophotalea acetylenivorans]APG28401.1 hypothetical protein A7E78_11410 [Syntrophotalea acetylenivorans]
MLAKKPLIFWVTFSLALHVVILAWCPVPSFYSPPSPIYLVVDLFSGPATSGTGHGLDDESADGGKTKDSPTALPNYPKHRLKKDRSPQLTTPVASTKVTKEDPAYHETDTIISPPEIPPTPEESITTNKSMHAVTVEPIADRQYNLDNIPETSASKDTGIGHATGSGFGTGTGPGSGHSQGGQAGSGSPVETPFAYGSNPPPSYPSTARRRGWEGEVLLLVEVSAAGEVRKITVRRSSGYQILDRTALNAVYRWKFQAALRNGRAVAGKVMVPIRFNIKDAK